MTTGILPNGKSQFIDINGKPLVGGTVTFYEPGTLVLKDTWQDSAKTILNTNPIVLDSRGQALIYGDGIYRQRVKDSLGNLIWDELTNSPADLITFLVAEITIDGNGSTPSTGIVGDSYVPVACTLGKNLIQAIGIGSCEFDVWVAPFIAGTPPTIADSIVGANPPTLSGAQSSIDTSLTGWTIAIPANSAIRYNLNSISGITHCTLSLVASIP